MFEQITQTLLNALSHVLFAALNKLVPLVGVGGSVETLETVPPSIVLYGLVVLAVLGVVFGIALVIALIFGIGWYLRLRGG